MTRRVIKLHSEANPSPRQLCRWLNGNPFGKEGILGQVQLSIGKRTAVVPPPHCHTCV